VQWQFYDAQQPIANLSIPQGVTLPDGELLHFSVGMVIYRDSELLLDGQRTTVRQIMLIRRTLHPRGFYALPAGHLERGEESDEEIKLAAMREAHEETCLMVWRPRLLAFLLLLEDDCRRGVDYHVWHLFEGKGEGKVCMDYESDIIGWYTRDEVQTLREKLVKPARDFFDMNLLFPL
jgi:ADP-ribose pyrophosphatase YjhB (NUDIX family)